MILPADSNFSYSIQSPRTLINGFKEHLTSDHNGEKNGQVGENPDFSLRLSSKKEIMIKAEEE